MNPMINEWVIRLSFAVTGLIHVLPLAGLFSWFKGLNSPRCQPRRSWLGTRVVKRPMRCEAHGQCSRD